jgi:hypothetical protein
MRLWREFCCGKSWHQLSNQLPLRHLRSGAATMPVEDGENVDIQVGVGETDRKGNYGSILILMERNTIFSRVLNSLWNSVTKSTAWGFGWRGCHHLSLEVSVSVSVVYIWHFGAGAEQADSATRR